MKLNPSKSALRLEPPRTTARAEASDGHPTPAPLPTEAAPAAGDSPDRNEALRPTVPSQLSLEPTGAGPAPANSGAPGTLDPQLSSAKDDQAAFQAAQQLLEQSLGQAPPKAPDAPKAAEAPSVAGAPADYGALFGRTTFVADGADAELLKLLGQAVAKAPELAGTPLAEHVRAGRVGRDDVRSVQEFLQKKGYSVGPAGADGLYGPRTHAALAAFLKGDAPASTHDHGEGPTLRRGASGEAVRKLQERRKELGFDPQGADGQFGPHTLAAVKAFQAARGLEVDGIVGPQTWDRLGIRVAASEVDSVPELGADGIHQTEDGPMVMRNGKYMRAELAPHWDQMAEAAARDGIKLRINSGYRSKEHQARLWQEALQKYGSADKARKWVAPPGNSNHQHGKALDIELSDGVYAWLKHNGPKFGFEQRMSWEPWHWEHDL